MGKLAPVPAVAPQAPETPPCSSLERDALALALDRFNSTTAEVERIKQAMQRHGDTTWWPAQKTLDGATATLAELQASESRALAAAYLGDSEEATKLDDARRAFTDARAAVERAEKVREGLAERSRDAEAEFNSAKVHVDEAVDGVVNTDGAIPALIARYEAARRNVAELEVVMALVRRYLPYPYRDTYAHPVRAYDDLSQVDAQAWRDALKALKRDPYAQLPS